MAKTIIMYHAHCLDGSMAALIVADKLQDADMYPINYDEQVDLKLCAGANVVCVDFCPKPYDILDLDRVVNSLQIFDHHQGAIDALDECNFFHTVALSCTTITFELEHSGAGLAMKYINPDWEYKTAALAVEDRDLWKFKLPETKAICAALKSAEGSLLSLQNLLQENSTEKLIAQGNAIITYCNSLYASIAQRYRRIMWYGYPCAVIDAPPEVVSELSDYILISNPASIKLVLSYHVTIRGSYKVSLRSRKGSDVDVNKIAQDFGGGGHPSAAGFYADASDLPCM